MEEVEEIDGYTFYSRGLNDDRRALIRELIGIQPSPLAPYKDRVWGRIKGLMNTSRYVTIRTNVVDGKHVTISVDKKPMCHNECIFNVDISVHEHNYGVWWDMISDEHRKYAYEHGYAPTRNWKKGVAIDNEWGRDWEELEPVWHGIHEIGYPGRMEVYIER